MVIGGDDDEYGAAAWMLIWKKNSRKFQSNDVNEF